MTTLPPSTFGVAALRSEDPRFLTGRGRYVENLPIEGALRAVFARSIMPHARVNVVQTDAAREMPGVAGVFTATDLDLPRMPPSGNVEGATGTLEGLFGREVLARDVVRFVGEPVAIVVADSLAHAEDAAEAVVGEYEPLEAVIDVEAALAPGSPVLWPEHGSNVAATSSSSWNDDVLEGSDVVVRARFVNQRLAPVPMEGNSIAVEPHGDGTYTAWVSTQVPFDVRDDLADALGVERAAVRTIAPDVGGGFGAKLQVYPEYLAVAAAAARLGRPVRWIESRSEGMVALTHGRAQVQHVEVGARRDGTIVGLRADLIADMGAYPIAAFLPNTTQEMLSGVYAIGRIASRARSVVTNATPVAPYRGAGRPEATALVERAIDMVAAELELDPIEVRRRNLIQPDAFPHRTAAGTVYDTGEYERVLGEARRLAGYDALRAEQAARRERSDHLALGIGVASYVEITSFSSKEFASVEVHADGAVTVLTGTSPHGQGHETAFAQLASGVLGVPFDAVRVVHSDTGLVRRGAGTWGSRSLQAGGSSVFERCGEVLERARAIAAHALEADVHDVELDDGGGFAVRGAPERAIGLARVAEIAADASRLPDGMEPGLLAEGVYREPASTFPFGAHIAVVEVDTETGDVRLVRHVAVDDCGRVLNPALVEGQVHGGLAQGIAQALYEEVRYDDQGNPITSTLTTYAMPTAAEFPHFETARTETTTPVNPLGVKGIGESATIGSTPAVQNAVIDALSPWGVRHLDLPLTPERVWRALAADRGAVLPVARPISSQS
ncbi:MAG TPA: xanthine dehydrogenase family protein molybdopterin-binding subunit [Actinomycetota bacterium]